MDKYTIMVIDDQMLNIQMIRNVLSDNTITAALDGEQALHMLASDPLPDLILLDIILPGLNGFDVLKRIKANSRTMNIPVIFITGLNSVENEEEGFNLGAVDYIVKPFNPAIVRARVGNTLRLLRQQRLLEDMAHIDGLTAIPNRRKFDITLELEYRSAFRNKRWLTLIMIDVDQFKHYNDYYGHAKGDEALIQIAATIRSALRRPYDFAARFGGEEFAVILPDTDEFGGKRVAENIRQAVIALKIPHQNPQGEPWLTISLGGYSLIPGQEQSLHANRQDNLTELIEKADTALYQAKKQQKNCVDWIC